MAAPQTGGGHDMDHYADDPAALTEALDLKDAVHVGHSTGGGEVVHYLARHGESRVAKAAVISAVPPLMVETAINPSGLPKMREWKDVHARTVIGAIPFGSRIVQLRIVKPENRKKHILGCCYATTRKRAIEGIIWS
jgi:pimeloyl-ACP methyl ester carboxylesterase